MISHSARVSPTPNTVWVRVLQRSQAVQAATSSRSTPQSLIGPSGSRTRGGTGTASAAALATFWVEGLDGAPTGAAGDAGASYTGSAGASRRTQRSIPSA